MKSRAETSYPLSAVLAVLMLAHGSLGLLFQGQYRDVAWIRATWFGNDCVTLIVAVPLLAVAPVRARRGSLSWQLLWYGLLGYGVYNYAYYLLGAALNAFFPLYVCLLLLAAGTLGLALSRVEVQRVAASMRPGTPVRIISGYFLFVAVALTGAWLSMWAAYVFTGRPTPVEPEAFKLVAALDLTIMVPALATCGILLWRGRPWGHVLAPIAGVQAALYLLVLSVNSVVAISRGLVRAPGELPLWGVLTVLTVGATGLLLVNERERGLTAP
jgi:hypothetical protein